MLGEAMRCHGCGQARPRLAPAVTPPAMRCASRSGSGIFPCRIVAASSCRAWASSRPRGMKKGQPPEPPEPPEPPRQSSSGISTVRSAQASTTTSSGGL